MFIYGVREDLEIDDVVRQIVINGNDNEIMLFDTNTDYFRFESGSRAITVSSPFAYNGRPYNLDIRCVIASPDSPVELTLEVRILTVDVNDHSPQFVNAHYYTNITESAPVGSTLISTISATDDDPTNQFISYSILPGDYADHFEFPLAAQGRIVLTKKLDFEVIQTIQLSIAATDKPLAIDDVDQQRLTSFSTVTINVLDDNDQNPIFTSSGYYEGSVKEDDTIGTVIQMKSPPISAHDPDVMLNAALRYTIVPEPLDYEEHQYFEVDPDSGQLTLAMTPPSSGRKMCILLKVFEVTSPDRFSHALVRVSVEAPSFVDTSPRFLQAGYVATLTENSAIGSSVVTVGAVSSDETAELRYSFVDDYPEFTINSISGVITTGAELDFESSESHTLNVQVSSGSETDEAEVSVTISDVNDNNPVFAQTVYTFASAAINKNQQLVQVQATDADRNNQIRYTFLDSSANSNFSLNAQTGDVTCLVDDVTQTTIVIEADDNGVPPRKASCVIHITSAALPVVPEVARAEEDSGDSNMVVVIVLAILSAILFVVIILMAIYIFWRKLHATKDPSNSNSRCVRSSSFEQNPMNFSSKNYKSYLDPVDAYKPSDRHLKLYNGVPIDDATTTQQNPFTSENSLDRNDVMVSPSGYPHGAANIRDLPSHSAAVDAGLYPQHYPLDGATVESSSDRRSAAIHAQYRNDALQHTAQIDYDPSVTPIDLDAQRLNGFHGYNQGYEHEEIEVSPRSSVNSENSYNHGELTSFKVGSTTQLVPHTNSMPKSSLRSLKGSGNISFVDNSPANSMYSSLTSQQSGLEPTASTSDHHKPGIIVYY